jgi:hypothetical protein
MPRRSTRHPEQLTGQKIQCPTRRFRHPRPDGLIGYLACRNNTRPRYVDAWQSKDPREALADQRSPISDGIPTVLAQNRTIGAFSAAASQPLVKAPSRR